MKTQKERILPKGISQRSDGRYQATYSFQGNRYYLYDMDLNCLIKKLHEKLYEIEHGIYCKPQKIRLNQWFEIWLKEYKELSLKKQDILMNLVIIINRKMVHFESNKKFLG